jgi:hypothetical protein
MSTENTRRDLFGAGAGLLLLTAPSFGGAKAAEHDGQLLALAAELQALDERIAGFDHDAPGNTWEAFEALQGEYWEVFEKLDGIPARTPEGIQAKARVARSLIAGGGIDRESATGRHIEGLLADLLGEVQA